MSKPDLSRLDEMKERYPAEPCRQIAAYVLESADAPERDRVCAAGIFAALDAADHAMDLAILELNRPLLLEAAQRDADLLWSKYDEDGEYRPSRRDPEEPPDSGTQNGTKLRSVLDSSAEILRKASSLPTPGIEQVASYSGFISRRSTSSAEVL